MERSLHYAVCMRCVQSDRIRCNSERARFCSVIDTYSGLRHRSLQDRFQGVAERRMMCPAGRRSGLLWTSRITDVRRLSCRLAGASRRRRRPSVRNRRALTGFRRRSAVPQDRAARTQTA